MRKVLIYVAIAVALQCVQHVINHLTGFQQPHGWRVLCYGNADFFTGYAGAKIFR
jgi:hypothetical protein